jgi:IclR family transcriptional regulator, acetate operon repressor
MAGDGFVARIWKLLQHSGYYKLHQNCASFQGVSMENDARVPERIADEVSGEQHSFSLIVAAKILDAVSNRKEPSHLADICRFLELPRPTVFRVLSVLEQAGLIGRHADGRHFGKSQELSAGARAALLNKEHQATRREILESLVDEVGHTCNLTIPNGNSVMYLDRIEKRWPLSSSLHPGAMLPLYASACGKLFLSHMPLAVRDKFVRQCPLVQITGNTFTDPASLKAEFLRILDAGYSLDNEEYLPGIYCLAVPVYNPTKKLVAAVAMHWGMEEEPLGVAISQLPSLHLAAKRIGAMIDW